jgi:hypothetical protein
MKIPSVHQSTADVWPVLRMTSGAMYSIACAYAIRGRAGEAELRYVGQSGQADARSDPIRIPSTAVSQSAVQGEHRTCAGDDQTRCVRVGVVDLCLRLRLRVRCPGGSEPASEKGADAVEIRLGSSVQRCAGRTHPRFPQRSWRGNRQCRTGCRPSEAADVINTRSVDPQPENGKARALAWLGLAVSQHPQLSRSSHMLDLGDRMGHRIAQWRRKPRPT